MSVELSVLVPCFNEEGNLPELVERTERVFDRQKIAGEIVLVNDGSTDDTGAHLDALAASHPRVVAVHHRVNRGIPTGWKSAFERSSGRYVCTIDADLQYQPEAIGQLYREMCFSKADLVQGWRSSLERHQYDIRYYMSRGLDHLLKFAFAMHEHDVKSGFVLYKREAFEDILQHAPGYYYFQHLITVAAKAKGYSIRQVETLFEERRAGHSFIGVFPFRMIARSLIDIGRAIAEFRLRETKDQSLALALAGRPSPAAPPAEPWRRHHARIYRALMPLHHTGVSRNGARYLRELRRTQWLPRGEIEQLQQRRLRRLIQHAYDHVAYYRDLFQDAGLVPDDIRTLDDLQRIPVLDKDAVRANLYFELLSDNHSKRKIEKVATSGARGEVTATFVDHFQLDMRWANAMRGVEWTGYRLPDRQARLWRAPTGGKGARGWNERADALLSRRTLLPAFALDEASLRHHAATLRRLRPALVDGDAEAFTVLAHHLAAQPGDGVRAGAVVSWGETMPPATRALVEQQLGARVFDEYGARECGPVAQECDAHAGHHVHAESFIVEVLRGGRRAAEGEIGELVITDLNNRCVPLLRYRLGDLAVATTRACACGRGLPLLERIVGRPPGMILGAAGRIVLASFFADLFRDYEYAVLRYQVAQDAPDRVDVRIVRKSRFTSATEDAIRGALARELGVGVSIRFDFVEAIPPDRHGRTPACVSSIPLPFPLLPAPDVQTPEDRARHEAAG